MRLIIIFQCILFLSLQQLHAQDDRYAVGYMSAVSNYAALFSGNLQQPLTFKPTNHPYFVQEDFASGRLSYGGVVYPSVWLRWDLYRDELMVMSPTNHIIVLKSEHIDFAELYGYRIIYLRPDDLPGCPPVGNYIQLNKGDFVLLEKIINELHVKANTFDRFKTDYSFVLSSIYYLQKNGEYHRIKNRRTLLKTLETHRSELRRFIQANQLNYKRDAEKMVLEVINEHEKLNQQ